MRKQKDVEKKENKENLWCHEVKHDIIITGGDYHGR
jgi:hypothetical protein